MVKGESYEIPHFFGLYRTGEDIARARTILRLKEIDDWEDKVEELKRILNTPKKCPYGGTSH